jgi:hypothetical protein
VVPCDLVYYTDPVSNRDGKCGGRASVERPVIPGGGSTRHRRRPAAVRGCCWFDDETKWMRLSSRMTSSNWTILAWGGNDNNERNSRMFRNPSHVLCFLIRLIALCCGLYNMFVFEECQSSAFGMMNQETPHLDLGPFLVCHKDNTKRPFPNRLAEFVAIHIIIVVVLPRGKTKRSSCAPSSQVWFDLIGSTQTSMMMIVPSSRVVPSRVSDSPMTPETRSKLDRPIGVALTNDTPDVVSVYRYIINMCRSRCVNEENDGVSVDGSMK